MSSPTALPEALPDARTAQRLLDVLATLEQRTRASRQAPPATEDPQLNQLRTQLRLLQARQQQAADRLERLHQRLSAEWSAQPEPQAQPQVQPESAAPVSAPPTITRLASAWEAA